MAKKSIAQLEKAGLKRSLGVTDLFSVAYGDLGSSIYYALGVTALFSLGATPISLLLAGLVFVCTALTYAEMTAMIKDSGGSASFARHAFNDFISFIAGWGLLLDFIITIAISIFSIAPYLSFITPEFKLVPFQIGFSIALIGVLYAMNYFGVKHSTRISIVLTVGALLSQIFIVVIAVFGIKDFAVVFEQMRINVANVDWSPTWPQFWKGTAMAMVAYTGIESIAALGSETKKPAQTLPKAVILVMFVLIFMYLGISVVGLSVMTPNELGTTYMNDPISGIVAHLPFGSHFLGPWIGILGAALLFVAGNAGMMGASRLSYNMGEFYQLPRFFSSTHKRFRTPYVALAIFGVLACLVILLSRGQLTFLADLYNFGAMLAFCSAHLSLIVLRIKRPDHKRPFRAPLNIPITKKISLPLTAIVGTLATFSVWVLVVVTKKEGRILGLAWLIIGMAMYFYYRRQKKMEAMGNIKIQKVKVPGFKALDFKKILVLTKGGKDTESVQIACELAKVHHAKLTAIHFIEVPFSLPLEAPLEKQDVIGQVALKRAEAIARDKGLDIETAMFRSRVLDESILAFIKEKHIDLVVIGASREPHAGLGKLTERIVKFAACPVIVASSK